MPWDVRLSVSYSGNLCYWGSYHKSSPIFHQLSSLFDKGGPQIMALDAADFVSEACFNHKRVIFGFLVSPCFECAAESMHGQFFVALHTLQRLEHCDIR